MAVWSDVRTDIAPHCDTPRSRAQRDAWGNALAAGYARIGNASQTAAYGLYAAAAAETATARYGVSSDTLFAAPANWVPASSDDLLFNCSEPGEFPSYENGEQFLVVAGYEFIAAARGGGLGATGMLARLRLAMAEYNRTLFFGQNRNWRADGGLGVMQGSDFLTDSLLLLWGGLRAIFGVEPTLRQGIVAANAPAEGLEGAWHAFLHLGHEVNVSIAGGIAVVSGEG